MTSTITTRKTLAEILAEQADSLIPVDGDRAYCVYHGLIWEGILKKVPWNGNEGWGGSWVIIPAAGHSTFAHSEGRYKYYEKLPTANVSVNNPTLTEAQDDWHRELTERGFETPERMVAFDVKRGIFYIRAEAD